MPFLDYPGLARFKSKLDVLFNTKLNTSLKGAANGLAELDENGKLLTTQLPEITGKMDVPTNTGTFNQYLRNNGLGGSQWDDPVTGSDLKPYVEEWLGDHIDPTVTTVGIDDTLTDAGLAADAAATGNLIIVSQTTPTGVPTNKIWIDSDADEAVVPLNSEFTAFQTEVNTALNAAPTHNTAEDLITEEEHRTLYEAKFLDELDTLFTSLPQDESLAGIYDELVIENEWLDMLYHELAAAAANT